MLHAFFAQFPAGTLPALRISPGGATLNISERVPVFFYTVSEKSCQGEILSTISERHPTQLEILKMSSAVLRISLLRSGVIAVARENCEAAALHADFD
jgi:hypothetical protein